MREVDKCHFYDVSYEVVSVELLALLPPMISGGLSTSVNSHKYPTQGTDRELHQYHMYC